MKPGRNERCPCGSGKKYKLCCGQTPAAPRAPRTQPTPAMPLRDEIGALVALIDRGRSSEAEPRARALLALHPDTGMLWKILSVALMRQDKDALAALRRTVQLLPADAEAHGNLGLALHDRGQWAEALPSLLRSLGVQPGDAQVSAAAANVLNHLGNERRDAGQLREAVALYRRAIKLDPARAESHCNLGNALLEARRIDEAAVSCAEAVALDPASALARVSLATVFRLQARGGEAEASCRAALSLDPDYVEALSLLGELLADQGRFSEAEQLFQRALTLDPDFSFAYCSIAAHRKMTAADTAWLDGARSLLAKGPALRHALNLNYALGKYFDDVERYDEAFGHCRRAHELARSYGSGYDAGKLTRRIDRLLSIFDGPFLSASRGRGSSSTLPVFVFGMPRSGTSLAEQILASHPAVFGAGEVTFWDAVSQAHEAQGLAADAIEGRLAGIAADYLERLRTLSAGAQRVIDKMPVNFLSAGLIHAAFPEARMIHMRRHPMDTCLSIYFQNFFNMGAYANELDHLADYYAQYLRITAHWRSVLPPESLLEVPYEGLVEDTEGWTRRMLDFIGLPWHPRCLSFHEVDRSVITASRWQVRQKIHGRSVGRWRNYQKHLGPLSRLMGAAGLL